MIRKYLSTWWRRPPLRAAARGPLPAPRCPRAPSARLFLEQLESRQLLSATDLFSSAVPIALNSGQPLAGIISPAPTYYALTVTGLGRLTAEVAPTGGATRLTLLSSDGQVLVQSDGQSPGNHNDLIDMYLTGSTAGTTYYLEVQGLGTTAGSYVLMPSYLNSIAPGKPLAAGIAPWSIATGDFNGDGNADLAVASLYTGQVSVFLGEGDGTFGPAQEFAAGPGAKSIVAVDFNGDGNLDLATANFNTDTISLLLGKGDGTFQPQRQFAAGGANPVALAVGDFNGDGKPDLAVADFGSNTVAVLTNNGDGTFATPTSFAVGPMPFDIVAGDFNGDGKLDLAIANSGSDTVSILLGNGNATFAPGTTVTVGQGPRALVARDFNGDGRLDLATANFGSADVSILLGRGDGTFTPKATLATGVAPTTIVAADFNGDGTIDLATGNLGDGTVSVFLGRADGTFDAQPRLAVGGTPSSLVATDLNDDGKIDLAFPDQMGNAAYVLLGTGDGTFQTQPPQSPMEQVAQVGSADFDDDIPNIPDILVTNSESNNVYQTISDPAQVFVGSFDSQPGLDRVTVEAGSNDLTFFAGFGPGHSVGLGGVAPVAAVSGDFNHDGTGVAGREEKFALLLGSSNGPQVTNVLASNLINVSDLALRSASGGSAWFNAAVDGTAETIPLTFVLDLTPILPDGLSTTENPAVSVVAEFSQVSDSELQLVATLIHGSSAAPVGTLKPTGQSMGGGEGKDAEQAKTDDGGDLARNAVITGTADTPLQQYLKTPANFQVPDVEIPLPSLQELFAGPGKVALNPGWQGVIHDGSGWTVANERAIETPVPAETPCQRWLTHIQSLAICVASALLGLERPVRSAPRSAIARKVQR